MGSNPTPAASCEPNRMVERNLAHRLLYSVIRLTPLESAFDCRGLSHNCRALPARRPGDRAVLVLESLGELRCAQDTLSHLLPEGRDLDEVDREPRVRVVDPDR